MKTPKGLIGVVFAVLVVVILGYLIINSSDTPLPEVSFSYLPPNGWTEEREIDSGIKYFPPSITNEESFAEISVMEDIIPDNFTREKYLEESERELIGLEDYDYKLISHKKSIINGNETDEYIFTIKLGDTRIKQKQVIFIVNNKAFMFSYGSLENSFDRYLKDFDESLESIKILFPY
ncbi:MAG: hypothetical protein Q7R86_01380 [bacterium]|nr:hypothetical protein [bacterium]